MTPREVDSYRKRLDSLFRRVASLSTDPELQAHWACYLCILVCGFLEVSVPALYAQYAKKRSNSEVTKFVNLQLRRFRNPNMERIYQLTESFNHLWAESLRNNSEGEIRDGVDSVVSLRNRIAHGESTSTTYRRMRDYYDRVLKLVRLIEELCS